MAQFAKLATTGLRTFQRVQTEELAVRKEQVAAQKEITLAQIESFKSFA